LFVSGVYEELVKLIYFRGGEYNSEFCDEKRWYCNKVKFNFTKGKQERLQKRKRDISE